MTLSSNDAKEKKPFHKLWQTLDDKEEKLLHCTLCLWSFSRHYINECKGASWRDECKLRFAVYSSWSDIHSLHSPRALCRLRKCFCQITAVANGDYIDDDDNDTAGLLLHVFTFWKSEARAKRSPLGFDTAKGYKSPIQSQWRLYWLIFGKSFALYRPNLEEFCPLQKEMVWKEFVWNFWIFHLKSILKMY